MKNPSDRPILSRGFTLVELLATITIIALLAALLFPAGKGVFKKALDAKCLGNLKTLHGGMTAYAADWQHWPTLNRETPGNPDEYGSHAWYYSLLVQGYIPTRKVTRDGYECLVSDVLTCPLNKANPGKRYPWTSSPYPWEGNYAINEFWGTHWGGTPDEVVNPGVGRDRVRTLAGVKNPNAILLVDSLTGWMYPGTDANWSKSGCSIPRNLHGNGANALLANGAVILLNPTLQPDLQEEKYWNPAYTAP